MSAEPHFLSESELRRSKRLGVAEGSAAIRAVSPARKGRQDSRDAQEKLGDLLCSLRFWAGDAGISFQDAIRDSEKNHMIETGVLAENHYEFKR